MAWHGMAWYGMAEIKAAISELLPSFLPSFPPLHLGGPAMPCSAGRSSRANLSPEEEEDSPEEANSARIRRHFAIIEMFRLRLLLPLPLRRRRRSW